MDTNSEYSGVFIDNGWGNQAGQHYERRRQVLLKEAKVPVLIRGVTEDLGAPNPWATLHEPVYQDPYFLYLTGINQPNVVLLLDPFSQASILFLPDCDPKKEFWEGKFLGYDAGQEEDLKGRLGVSEIQPLSSLKHFFIQYLRQAKSDTIRMFWHHKTIKKKWVVIRDFHFFFKQKVHQWLKDESIRIENMGNFRYWHGMQFSPKDYENLSEAQTISEHAFRAVCGELPKLKTETSVAALLTYHLNRNVAWGMPFFPIVATGKNAAILHYKKNNDPIQGGQLLLLDFGIRVQNMGSDISRTVPVSGRFNPLQKLLYEIVLATQATVESAVRPGATIQALNDLCWAFLEQELQQKFLNKGGKMTRFYDPPAQSASPAQPHFCGHLMGYQVHDGDPSRAYKTQALELGWVITNEPGLYGHFEISIAGKRYAETLGIRIEDNLLITEDGCKNLSQDIPKTVAEIESLLSRVICHSREGGDSGN